MARKQFDKTFITLADIYIAYRKAKSEAFYDNSAPTALDFAEFEQNIKENIEALFKEITESTCTWWETKNFIGDYYYVPKNLDDTAWNDDQQVHYRSVDPSVDWKLRFNESGNKKLDAQYRLVIKPTINYQIISALWILKVGHQFESKLDKNLSYGNRLRRKRHNSSNGELNHDSSGLFSPYFSAYKAWRENGLSAMRGLLEKGKNATAVTMDLAGFYHNASPNFLLKPSFLSEIDITLTKDQKIFTKQLLSSMRYWYSLTPDFAKRPEGALPVGISASKVISNVLLYQLDKEVHYNLKPAYYGRYVDDIFLVFETPENTNTGDTIISHISKKVDCIKISRQKGQQPSLRLRFIYAQDSDLTFTASKQKIFSLSSEHGEDFINQIESQIREQSSEYRLLPEVPHSSALMAEKTLLASPDASLIADALRKADVVSVKRMGLSLLIRDIENYTSDLVAKDWIGIREEFYGLVERYLLTPKGLFDLSGYLPRVFSLMISNQDFNATKAFLSELNKCLELLEKTTQPSSKEQLLSCREYLFLSLKETALKASTSKGFSNWKSLYSTLESLDELRTTSGEKNTSIEDIRRYSRLLLISDLGSRPYKDFWYYDQEREFRTRRFPRAKSIQKVLRLKLIKRFREEANLKTPHWPALAFPTRPLSIQEIAIICPTVLSDSKLFEDSILGLRGAGTYSLGNLGLNTDEIDGECYTVPKYSERKVIVALTNFETTDEQFMNALKGTPDRSVERYESVNRLINNILKTKPKADYIVFPECSMPRRWGFNIASRLARQNISFIAGLEYYQHNNRNNIIRNDCLVSLTTRATGYLSNLVFMQPKLMPAHEESLTLSKKRKKLYVPPCNDKALPIYKHGSYQFGVIVCSDLTNPQNRVRFQGKVDSLFVLEWNPDVKTFSFLVEGTAHDVHTFVVQVNNRRYGDSRVRAPYKVDYKRDSVRIKGGVSDYFVLAKIDYGSLRSFQNKSSRNSNNDEFKPVPIGFKLSKNRN
ncbi:Reverse transcriptase domain-containing protein [Vibrio chagasii]|nr:Reverse transcriptase domain-containing protein [Vibrio chagasii]CAH7414792.1 Reverse transcriptase domain-containing protein [Vibrio chagasii]